MISMPPFYQLWLVTTWKSVLRSLSTFRIWYFILVGLILGGVSHVWHYGEQISFALTWEIPVSILVVIIIVCLVMSPGRIWEEQQKVITDLSKIDRDDLQRMLYGFFSGHTFFYKMKHLCKEFSGRLGIEQLKDAYVRISVPAPRNSLAEIQFEFMNGRGNINAKYYFSILQQGTAQSIEDIYNDQRILLDDQSCFELKFVCDEHYILNDLANLRIFIQSWTK